MASPIYHNLLGVILMTIYIQCVVKFCDWAVSARIIPLLISRKIVHIAAACMCLWWVWFDESHWTWRLNCAVPGVYAIQLIVKGIILADPNDADVKTMSRTGRPIELCQGPLLFIIVFLYCGLYEFKTDTGVYILAALGFGDGVAPLVGAYFPLGYYTLCGETKTLSGSVGVFIGTLIGVVFLRAIIGAPASLRAGRMLLVALAASASEASSGKWDNPAIAICVWTVLRFY